MKPGFIRCPRCRNAKYCTSFGRIRDYYDKYCKRCRINQQLFGKDLDQRDNNQPWRIKQGVWPVSTADDMVALKRFEIEKQEEQLSRYGFDPETVSSMVADLILSLDIKEDYDRSSRKTHMQQQVRMQGADNATLTTRYCSCA